MKIEFPIHLKRSSIFFTKEQINKIYDLYTEDMPNFTPVRGVECYFKNANPDKIIFKGHDLGTFKIDGDIPKEGYEEYNISSPEKLFALKGDFKLVFDSLDDWHTKYTTPFQINRKFNFHSPIYRYKNILRQVFYVLIYKYTFNTSTYLFI